MLRHFVIGSAAAVAMLLAPGLATAQVYFTENFEDGNAASRWTVSQAGGSNLSNFAFDYSTVGIPVAPSGTGSIGLYLDANTGPTGAASSILAFPNGQDFTPNYTLAFDLWMNVQGVFTTSTQYAVFGGGHTSTAAQVPTSTGGPSPNGIDFALTNDEDAARDVKVFVNGVERTGTTPTTAGGYARSTAATGPQDEKAAPYAFAFTGAKPMDQWLEVAVTVTSTLSTWTINGNTWARTLATTGSGNIMIGLYDQFSSIAPTSVFTVYDNVRVTAPVATPTELRWSGDGLTAGGNGDWANMGRSWLGLSGSVPWNWALPAIFEGTAGTVTIPTGVTAGGGLRFLSDGYTITSGTLFLGATYTDNQIFDPNAIATVDVPAGMTATIASLVRGRQGLTKTGTGTLVLQNAAAIGGTTLISSGTLRLEGAGTIVSNAGASTINVASGAVFDVSAVSPFLVGLSSSNSRLTGSGTVVGDIAVSTFGRLQPGAGPGNLTVTGNTTLGSEGVYNWQIQNATGAAGTTNGWDLLTVGGTLNVDVLSGAPFQINLWSLSSTGPDVSGSAVNFSPTQSYTWKIATAAGGITNFAADRFVINVSATNGSNGFVNALSGGTFSMTQTGNDLNLVFTSTFAPGPDPNPTTLTWYGDGVNPGGGGTWTTTGTTWFDGTTVRPWVPGAKAIFSGTGGTVTLDSGLSANGGLQFTSTGYTLTGAGLVLGGTSNGVEVGSGLSATVATVLSG
ncbi:MAG: hypothetical protein ACKON7_10615, partial [Planctomycetaceae bacterium]